MIGLLKKDLYVAERSSRLLLVLALVFSLVPNFGNLGTTYAMMLAFMLPMNAIAYDERCKWDRYAAMMPYRPGQIVWGKYVLSYIYTLLGEAIILLGSLVRSVLAPGSVDWRETFAASFMLLLVMLLITALTFPALYRFGTEKGRIVMIVVLASGVSSAVAVLKVLAGDIRLKLPPMPVLLVAAAVALAGATAASFRLSVHFYKRRQNGAYA